MMHTRYRNFSNNSKAMVYNNSLNVKLLTSNILSGKGHYNVTIQWSFYI